MKILLAGYNIDTDVLRELEQAAGKRPDATPETLSAAYARISRDPRPIDELRKDARSEVERARKSNQSIIFKMGHHSVAEHAVFNFDILGVSRLAIEHLEKFRLCSYTEKSQRYITLENDFVVPQEVRDCGLEKDFTDAVRAQNGLYHEMHARLKDYVFQKNSETAKDPKKHNMLEGWAKEDARYITSLATEGQLGMTINARNLEFLFRRFASCPLKEVQEIGKKMYALAKEVAPSIILFTDPNDFDAKTQDELEDFFLAKVRKKGAKTVDNMVTLHHYTKEADDLLIACLMHHAASLDFKECRESVKRMSPEEKKEAVKIIYRHMEFFDKPLREFEFLNLCFELTVSASCFAQLKRHRMSTIVAQGYDPELGLTIPESIRETGYEGKFRDAVRQTESVYEKLRGSSPHSAPYILTNAHRRRVLFGVNARELYHVSRLREDSHAQWDIRIITAKMSMLAEDVMPLAMELIGSKEVFPEKYRKFFGKDPAFTHIPG
jgi:flavin-dependent thymidylate synthase